MPQWGSSQTLELLRWALNMRLELSRCSLYPFQKRVNSLQYLQALRRRRTLPPVISYHWNKQIHTVLHNQPCAVKLCNNMKLWRAERYHARASQYWFHLSLQRLKRVNRCLLAMLWSYALLVMKSKGNTRRRFNVTVSPGLSHRDGS